MAPHYSCHSMEHPCRCCNPLMRSRRKVAQSKSSFQRFLCGRIIVVAAAPGASIALRWQRSLSVDSANTVQKAPFASVQPSSWSLADFTSEWGPPAWVSVT